MPIPLKGDRSVRDMNYPNLHASDIEAEEFEYHVPPSSLQTVGSILYATSSGWVSGDQISLPLVLQEQTETPDNPAEGFAKIYLKDDGKLYLLLSDGTEIDLTENIKTDSNWEAKGDLIVGTSENTASILSVGSDNQILIADSSQPTGIKWSDNSGQFFELLVDDDMNILFDDNGDLLYEG